MAAETSQIIDSYYRCLKQRDREKLLELLGEDIVVTYHAQPGHLPWAGQFHGIAGFDEFFRIIRDHLNVIRVDVIASVISRARVVNQCEGVWEYRDTGYRVKGGMVNVFTVESGKITSYEVYADTAAFVEGFRGATTQA